MNRLKSIAQRFPNFSKKSIAIALSILMGLSVMPSLGVKAAGGANQSSATQQPTKKQLLKELPRLFYYFEFAKSILNIINDFPISESAKFQVQVALTSACNVNRAICDAFDKADAKAVVKNTVFDRAQTCLKLTELSFQNGKVISDQGTAFDYKNFDEVRAAYGQVAEDVFKYIFPDDGADIAADALGAHISTHSYVCSLARTCAECVANKVGPSNRLTYARVYSEYYAHRWDKGDILYNLIKDASEDSIIKLRDNLIEQILRLNRALNSIEPTCTSIPVLYLIRQSRQ